MDASTITHFNAAQGVLHYLKSTLEQGLLFSSLSSLSLHACCDFDWASCSHSRWSVTDYSIFLGHSLVSWISKKNLLSLDPLLKQSIKPWQGHAASLRGWYMLYLYYMFLILNLLTCIATIKKLYTSLPSLYFINKQNISSWIVIWFRVRSKTVPFTHTCSYLAPTCRHIHKGIAIDHFSNSLIKMGE